MLVRIYSPVDELTSVNERLPTKRLGPAFSENGEFFETCTGCLFAPVARTWRDVWALGLAGNLQGGLRQSETLIEDMFIRKFMTGTWHRMFVSEILIKRRHNMVMVGGIVQRSVIPRKMYFLLGYTEEILSYVLKCPVKLELQSTADKKDMVFKYI